MKVEMLLNNNNNDEKVELLNNDEIKIILNINSENANNVIDIADRVANELKDIPSSKFREFYDYVININEEDEDWYKKLVFLKPKLAYNYGKETNRRKKEALEKLWVTFSKIIDEIDGNKSKFKNFKTFFEALVAYHKIYSKN
ncbi:type III-A CRISPR-associated protein Csm2 [Methanocaldococcus sp.]